MIKFKMFLDKDKEVLWLNEMAAQGWAMKRFFAGLYKFEPCEKGEYQYQVDLARATADYKDFMEDAGIEVVQSWGPWVILRKKSSEGEFELYTDAESQIGQYKKILYMFKAVTILEVICLTMEIIAYVHSGNAVCLAACFLIGTFILVFVRMIIRTKAIINVLREKKNGMEIQKGRNISMILPAGLLMNSVALIGQDRLSDYIRLPIQIAAIVLMITGSYFTAKKRKEAE